MSCFFYASVSDSKQERRKPLGGSGEDRFWSRTITPEEYACYYAIMLEDHSMDFASIQDDKKVLTEMEGYANSGMGILLEEFLSDYCTSARQNRISAHKRNYLRCCCISFTNGFNSATIDEKNSSSSNQPTTTSTLRSAL